MNNVVALLNLHNDRGLGLLTENRPLGSTPFLGRYALMDFALSNITNSGIDQIGILIKDHSRSIIKHLGGDSVYLRNPKTGFEQFFLNEKGLLNPDFNTDIHNIMENDWFLFDKNVEYVIVVPVHYLIDVDYNEVIKEHKASNRRLSILTAEISDCKKETYSKTRSFTIDALGDIQKVSRINGKENKATISLQTYIFNKDLLKEMIMNSDSLSEIYNLNDLVAHYALYKEKVHAINFKGRFRRLVSLKDYYDTSMFFLNDEEEFNNLFKDNWPIYTQSKSSRPVLYGKNCEVSNSLISNGCKINGTVKNSILSRKVKVEEGAVVEDCIIFTNTTIKKGVKLKNCVIDKHCIFENKKVVKGSKEKPLYIHQGAKL